MSSFENLVDSARAFACGVYRQQPGALIPNPGEALLRLAWDNLCDYPGNPGLPLPPAPPFTGGQCECITYRVFWTLDCSDDRFDESRSVFCYGPVVAMRFVNYPDGTAGAEIYCRGAGTPGCGDFGWYPGGLGYAANFPFTGTITIDSIVRSDSQPDNCGNPPSGYPPVAPPPPEGYTSPLISVSLADGDEVSVRFNFSPPMFLLDSVPSITVNLIEPEVNPEVKVPIKFDFNGDINVGVPQSLDVDLLPEIVDKVDKIGDDFENFKEDFDYVFYPPSFINNGDIVTVVGEEEEEGEKEREGLLGVKVEIVKLPDKAQFGTPPVYFSGWLAFKTEQGYLLRQPVHFQPSYFVAPPGSIGYAYTFTNGAKGFVTEYSKEKKLT